MAEVIVGLIVGGFLLLILVGLFRLLLSVVGLGPWACSKGWHWRLDFPLHVRRGFMGRTTTYLAVAEIKIYRCRTCGVFSPPEGQVVYEQWRRGGAKTVGGGIFSSPKLKADREAARAINSVVAHALANAPPQKPKGPRPRWMILVGSSAIVQQGGKYLMVVTMFPGGICVFASLSVALDKHSTAGEALFIFLLGAGLLGVAFGIAALTDAGIERYVLRQRAEEATRDPVGFHRKSVEFARQHGMEIPSDVTPEMLALTARKRADEA